jgi:hypothetical protein
MEALYRVVTTLGLSASYGYIYGPARAVKEVASSKTRFGTDAAIYPYMDSSRPAS